MSSFRIRAGAIVSAAALSLGLVAMSAASAAAAPVRPAAAGSIIAPCTPIQDGEYRWYGTTLTECKHVPGLGYYWVKVSTFGGCAVPGVSRETPTVTC